MAVKRGRAAAFSVFKNKKKEDKKTGANSKPQSSASSNKQNNNNQGSNVPRRAQGYTSSAQRGRQNNPTQRNIQTTASNRVAQSQNSRANTPTSAYQKQKATASTSAEMRKQREQNSSVQSRRNQSVSGMNQRMNRTATAKDMAEQKNRNTASTAANMRRQQEYEKMAEERKQNLPSRREDKTSHKDYERANFERNEQVVEAGKKATKAITKAAKNFKNLDSTNYTQGIELEDDRDFGTDVAKSFKHGFKEAAISTRAAGERVWRNSLKSGRPMELSRQSGDWTESEEEKKFYKNQISKSELRQAGLREKIKEEQAKIHELESKQDSTLAKWTMGAASSGGGMVFDRLTGPMSLLTMGVRVTEGARGDVTDKADALKKEMLSSGNYSQEEVDELFKDVNKWDLANALGQGSIEALSEMTFGGIGVAAKYTPAGGILDKAVGKLAGRLGSSAVGRLGLGVSEEIAEEEIGNPLQTMWSNRIYGDKLQAMQEDSIRRAYSKEADTLEDNLATSENINSEEFLEQSKALYKKTGASDEEAEKLALMARDYFNARLEGDEKAEEDAMNKIVDTLAGGSNSLQEKWTLSDAANVAGSTAIMTGLTGLPSVMTTSQKGNEYRQNYGIQGVKNIAKVVENLDSQNSPRAKAVLESIEKGKEPTGTQIYNLITWSNKAVNEAKDLEVARDRDVQARMKQEKLYAPIVDADYNLAPATEERFEDIVEKTIDTIKSLNLNMDEAEMYPLADVVAAYETGTITSEQLNELNIESPENRKAFESATGVNLDEYTVKDKKGNIDEAASNIEMHKALFAKSTENYMTSARIEQEAWNDEARVEMANSLSSNMLSGGSVAVQNALKTVDPMDRGKFMLTGSAVRSVYEEARFRNTSWEDVSKTLKNRFPGVDKEVLHNVFNEAKTDRSMAEDANYGKQVKAGEPMDKKSLKDSAPVRVPGKVIDLRENPTNNLSSLSFITSAAKVFGVNIQLTDNLVARDSKGNEVLDSKGNPLQVEGTQSGTTILINTNEGILRAADDIAKHELIHQIRTNAPEEFKVFARLAMDRMHRANPEEFKKSIQSKQEQYKSVDENMTPEAAFEEMIANGSVSLDWEQLIADVQADNTIQNKSRLLEAIKNAVAEVLRKLRSLLSMDNAIDDEDVRTAVIDEIMQQQDVYDLLVRAASEAKANESAVAIDAKQDEMNAQNEKAGEDADVRFSISEQQDADYMKAVEDGDMETAQKMVDEAAAKAMPNTATPGRWFHGTENDFTVFDFSQGGKNGAAEGFGIYLARDKDVSEHYGKRMIEGYANIEHPATDTERTLSREDLVKLISATVDQEAERLAEDYDGDVEAAKKDTWISNYTYTYDKSLDASIGEVADSILDMNENDKDIIQEAMAGMAIRNYSEAEKFYDILTDLTGIDGFTTTWENIALEGTRDIALAFRSEQIKDSAPVTYDDNGDVIPLSQRFDMQNPDIRYSLGSDSGIMDTLKESFDEYKEDETNLRIATEALDDLQRVRFALSESSGRDVSRRWDGGVQVRTIGKGITTSLLNEGRVDFRGQTVETLEDLAKLCQVLRDPRFETFRVVLTKGDKIVSFRSISSRLPGVSAAFELDDIRESIDLIKNRMDRLGADGYYLIHNHPSGDVNASYEDLNVTRAYLALLGQNKYKGHIILDHDEYGYIDADIPQQIHGDNFPTPRIETITGQQTIDFIHEPEMDHPVLGSQIKDSGDVAKVAQTINSEGDVSVLIYTSSKASVRGVQEISNKALRNNKEIGGYIRNQAIDEFGSPAVFLYTTDLDTYNASKKLIESGHLVDSVIGYGAKNGATESGRANVAKPGKIGQLGLTDEQYKRGKVVFESAAGADNYSSLKYSITPKMDADYMAAVESNNMEEAQRLVEEAATSAGYDTYVYHGTGANFTKFDFDKSGRNHGGYSKYGQGFYFTDSEEVANYWGKNRKLMKTYISLDNPFDASGFLTDGPVFEKYKETMNKYFPELSERTKEPAVSVIATLNEYHGKDYSTKLLKELGYDGVIAQHSPDDWVIWGGTKEYVVFDAENIKSADTVTYAEDGSVIPLSERFNPENNDIRYSMPTQDSDEKILTDGQMKYFKNSQARDDQGRLLRLYHGTQNGGFTIFDPSYGISSRAFFFTNSLASAKGYSGTDVEFTPDMAGEEDIRVNYPVYLDMQNPLIVDAEGHAWVDIPFDGDYVSSNWLVEYAQSEGYDSVIIKNVIDRGSADTELAPQDDYIVFNSNQVKDINNENPTENPDIRYSIVDEDEVKARQDRQFAYDNSYEALMHYEKMFTSEDASEEYDLLNDKDVEAYYRKAKRFVEKDVDAFYSGLTPVADRVVTDDPVLEEGRVRMAKSKEDFFNSNIAKWNDRWLTDGTVLDVESVKKEVRDLVMAMMQNSDTDRQYKTGLVNKTLIDMRLAYDYAKRGQTDIASAILWHSAQKMIDNVEFYREDDSYATYKDLRDYLRTTKIALGNEYWSDVAGGEFGRFRKKNYGRLKLVKGYTNVDAIYQELEERWPEWFNTEEEITPPDMLEQISHVLDVLQPVKEAYSSEEAAEVTQYIAEQLTDIMDAGKELHSLADDYKKRLDEKTKAMKLRHEEAMRKVREQRDKGIKAEKAKWQVKEEKRRERASHKKAFASIEKSYKTLTERLFNNTADSHIPQQYKKELAGLLASFDMQTEGSKKREARTGHVAQKTIKLSAIKTALTSIENNTQLFHINDAITDLIDELTGTSKTSPSESIDGLTIDELSVTELIKVDKLLKALVHEFNNYEKVRVGTKKQQAADIGKTQVDSALEHAKTFGSGKDYQNLPGFLDNIINLDEVTPAYMFRRIDPENNGLGLMWKEIRRSFDKYVRNQNQLNEWIDDIVGKYHKNPYFFGKYGAGELADWRSENYSQVFNLTNDTIQLTPAQMMSVYCLSKRAQAVDHMTGDGIVVAPVSYNAKILSDEKKKINKALSTPLADADIKQIIDALTPEQIKVADELQELLSTKMAQWGNEASMDVIGIELFTEKDYFPIRSDKSVLTKDLNANEFQEAIRNFGFTKAVQPGAKNTIVIDDIFNVVTEHCNNMNLYNSYSATINDFMKVYNYKDNEEGGTGQTVEQAIRHAYSDKAAKFIMTFIRDLNGNVSGRPSGIESIYNGLLANAKKASVFANLRVAAQQPTAITRAFAEISPKYIKGIKIEKGAMEEMFEHAPIALWKSWGYYDINMGKSIEDIMMNEGKIIEDLATDLYGALDNVTWTAIWQMVKSEMKDTHPDVKVGTDEYWELCNERFSEIIDLTQVVDSPMHRSHAMRDKGFFHKMTTSFMAEPTVTFNLLKAGYVNAWEQYKLGNTKEATKIFARTNAVILLQAAAVSAAAGFVDALRGKGADDDDDDDEKSKLRRILALWEKNTFENFIDELKPYNKIYVVKDIASMFEGWDDRNLALQGFQLMSLGLRQVMGDPYARSSKSWYENLFGGVGYLTGIPVKTMMTGLENAMGLFGVSIPAIDNTKDRLDKIAELNKERRKESGDEGGYFSQLFSKVMSDEKTEASASPDTDSDTDSDTGSGSGSKGGMSVSYEDDAQALYDASREYEDMLADAQKAADGYEGEDRNKRIWQSVSKDYKKYMEIGDIGYLEQMRDVVEEMGGDLEYFDERMISTAKSTLKKSLSYESGDADLQARIGSSEYLRMRGLTEEEISEVCYKSEMAKDLKVAFRLGDEKLILESAQPLVDAGLTDADWEKLWKNRNRLDIKKYDGKYKDQLKSQGTFIWPTEGTITSHFGRRNAPTAGASSNHPAIDIGAAEGTPVLASDGGVVITAGKNGGYGNSVGIKHDNGMVTYYNHLYGWNVKEGDVVAQGQQIGQVGSTGISTGPHLDFKILDINGNAVDPEQYLQ